MSPSNTESEDHLKALETLLDGGPDGQETALSDLLHKLESFIEKGDIQQAESTVQLLGTAVGADSKAHTHLRLSRADITQLNGKLHFEKVASCHLHCNS